MSHIVSSTITAIYCVLSSAMRRGEYEGRRMLLMPLPGERRLREDMSKDVCSIRGSQPFFFRGQETTGPS